MLGLRDLIDFVKQWSEKHDNKLTDEECIDLANQVISRGKNNTVHSAKPARYQKMTAEAVTKRIISFMLENNNKMDSLHWNSLSR